ncbi:MAG: DUF721 domain-containing protein [Marinirhabdus sp.]
MPKRKHDNIPLSEALQNFIKTNRLDRGLDRVNAKQAWHELLGPGVSNYTTEVKLDRGTLFVSLSSSVLRQELSYGRGKIIVMLNEHLGKGAIKKLVLR